MTKQITGVKFRITGGLKRGWIPEPHTYEVFFSDGSSVRVEAFTSVEAEQKAQVAS